MRHHQHMVIDPLDEPRRFEIGEDSLARLEPVEAAIGFGHRIGQMRVAIEDVDQFEAVPPPDLEIIEVMRGRDLDGAAAHLGIGIVVGDDRNEPADQRQPHRLSHEIGVARVIRMNRDAGIAEHRLGARGCDHDESRGIVRAEGLALDRVAQIPEAAPDLDLLHLEIGDCG